MRQSPGLAIVACAFGLAAYAVGLVITLPASFIDAGLERTSRGIVRLADAQGSLWSGSGQLEFREKGVRIGNPHHLAWHFQPWSLLRGHLAFEVELDQATRRAILTAGLSRVELSNADIVLPAAVLGLAEPKLAPFKLGGELSLHIPRLAVGRQQIEGKAVLQWRGATSALTTVAPLGDYELNIAGSGTMIEVVLQTLQGPLQIDGKGAWTSGGNAAFTANARIPPPLRQQLAPLLGLIAVERSAGNFEIQLK